MIKQLLIYLCIFLPTTIAAESTLTPTIKFTSPIQQTTLLELYTSEGCSSCPPADRWFSALKDHPQLWNEIIPIAFHVDYWDYLGWKDKFSRAEYSQRQRNYAHFKHLKTVYTPGFLHNGNEWRAWFRHRSLKTHLGDVVGRLMISISDNTVSASFRPVKPITGPLQLNTAWLGFDLLTEVTDGENGGKKLRHDFVSLGMQSSQGQKSADTYYWKFTTGAAFKNLPTKKGAAFWITRGNDPTPIQSTGGWM